MRAGDLDHKELLEMDPEGGVLRFAGQRAILLDAVAMGLLRKYLVENFGLTAARTVLTQFGFAHGWRMAEAMEAEFKWDNDEEWRLAGYRIHTMAGLYTAESEGMDPLSKSGMMLVASYEAEQHLLHFGRANAPMCWTISGLISGSPPARKIKETPNSLASPISVYSLSAHSSFPSCLCCALE